MNDSRQLSRSSPSAPVEVAARGIRIYVSDSPEVQQQPSQLALPQYFEPD
jgi:hypothetical protein